MSKIIKKISSSKYDKNKIETLEKISETVVEQLRNKMNSSDVITMSNLGQDVKEAMTGGTVAVVGSNCVGEDNLSLKLKENICESEIK